MFEEMGHTVALYDYFYANDPFVLHHLYDFITATEVVEHLHNPARHSSPTLEPPQTKRAPGSHDQTYSRTGIICQLALQK